jgi:hypothetical protein
MALLPRLAASTPFPPQCKLRVGLQLSLSHRKTHLSRGEVVEDALKRIKAAFVLPHPRKELLISMGRDSQKLSGSSLLAHLWHVTNLNLQ